MSVKYFRCSTCSNMFVGGDDTLPSSLICLVGRCEINEISEEEAEQATEELYEQ